MSGFGCTAQGGFTDLTYRGAKEKIGRARTNSFGTVSKNVRVYDKGDYVSVVLFETEIAQLYPDGSFKLFSGGYRTITTRRWLNEILLANYGGYDHKTCEFRSYSIWGMRGGWVVTKYDSRKEEEDDRYRRTAFHEGITFGPRGGIRNPISERIAKRERAKLRKLGEMVKQYAADFVKAFFAGKVPAPSGGDCWGCLMQTKEGKTMGELGGAEASRDHILGHIKAKYYVPTLLQHALEEGGWISQTRTSIMNNVLLVHWYGYDGGFGDNAFCAGTMYAALVRYLSQRMGIDIRVISRDRKDLVPEKAAERKAARPVDRTNELAL